MSELYRDLSDAVIEGNIDATRKLLHQALANGARAQELIEMGLIPGMDVVGQRFKEQEMFTLKCVSPPARCRRAWKCSARC